ncbi:MAG: hypothetical protein HQ580_15210 [Planctomycetes bacterium]|nr:hypothetical protein [Planctomycetota bacterium]
MKKENKKTTNEVLREGSPLLEQEDWAWDALLEIHGELQRQLAREQVKDSRECRRQLRLLGKKKYDKLEIVLIERCKSVGFCLGDEIEGEVRGLLKLATISSDPLIHKILTLIIRLAYQEGEL